MGACCRSLRLHNQRRDWGKANYGSLSEPCIPICPVRAGGAWPHPPALKHDGQWYPRYPQRPMERSPRLHGQAWLFLEGDHMTPKPCWLPYARSQGMDPPPRHCPLKNEIQVPKQLLNFRAPGSVEVSCSNTFSQGMVNAQGTLRPYKGPECGACKLLSVMPASHVQVNSNSNCSSSIPAPC